MVADAFDSFSKETKQITFDAGAVQYGDSLLTRTVDVLLLRLSISDATECWMQRHMQTSIHTRTQAKFST